MCAVDGNLLGDIHVQQVLISQIRFFKVFSEPDSGP